MGFILTVMGFSHGVCHALQVTCFHIFLRSAPPDVFISF